MNQYIARYYNLFELCKPGKALVIFGPRQVGKTTLLNHFLAETKLKYRLDSGDNIKTQEILGSQDFKKIQEYVAGYELLAIDEAQRIPNVGQGLKIIVDTMPDVAVIATGSSSFELSGQVGEPLTGRKTTITLYPIAQAELASTANQYERTQLLPDLLVYGSYPAIFTATSKEEKKRMLEELVQSYLLKDILELEQIKSSKILLDLLRLIAFQVGNEVSLTELGSQLQIDYKTVARYLDLFEKSFILYNLRGYSRNLRKEVTKKSKYYFYDNGIRNAIISNFNPLEIRNDQGQLWENFLVAERLKTQSYRGIYANNYFWRTWDQKEIDWIEEREGTLFAYEFKFSPQKISLIKDFTAAYPNAKMAIVHRENYEEFLG